ncbi:hypothetical protein LC612_43575, partial [Nostoc sp. CHAB 5834]|nr:hypothetical protein [Nostoc sp. CHAB 5834]
VAVDAFGNALGSSLAEAIGPRYTAQESFRRGEIEQQNAQSRTDELYGFGTGNSGQGLHSNGGIGLRFADFRATGALDEMAQSRSIEFTPDMSASTAVELRANLGLPSSVSNESWLLAAGSGGNLGGYGVGSASAKGVAATYADSAIQNHNYAKQLYKIAADLQKSGNTEFAKIYSGMADNYMTAGDKARSSAEGFYVHTEPMWKNSTAPAFSVPPGWSYMGANSIGYVQGRGILPDYVSGQVGVGTFSGTIAINLYDGSRFYGGGISAANANPGLKPAAGLSVGWIIGANNATLTSDHLGGAGTQFGITFPTPFALSPSVTVNHSYGGRTALEIGLVPSTKSPIIVYQPFGYSREYK